MSVFADLADGQVHKVQVANPNTYRASLYRYARTHQLNKRAYINWKTLPQATVVFVLGKGTLPELPDAPPRGRPSDLQDES